MKGKKAVGLAGKKRVRASEASAKHGKGRGNLVRSTLVAIGLVVLMLLALKLLSLAFPSLALDISKLVNGWGLFGVFVTIFIGSSLLPFPTDATFVVLVSTASNPMLVIAVSIIASFLSGLVNYALAFALTRSWVEQKMGKEPVEEAKEWLDAQGPWAIIIFGVIPNPLIDTMTFVAGLGKMDLKKFALYSAVARTLHFGLLAYLALQTKLL